MGIRIHTSIGWGMTAKDFEQHCLIKGDDVYEDIDDILSSHKQMTIPESFYDDKDIGHPLIENILVKNFLMNGQTNLYRDCSDLFRPIHTFEPEEGINYIMVYPNGIVAEDWQRYDDSIDYAMNVWMNDRIDPNDRAENFMQDDFRWAGRTFYPWLNQWMDAEGKKVDVLFGKQANDLGLLPCVPVEIRYLLTKTGIMKYEDTLRFRPLVAKWWS